MNIHQLLGVRRIGALLLAGAALTAQGCGDAPGSGTTDAAGLVRRTSAPARVASATGVSFLSSVADRFHDRVYVTWARSIGDLTRVYVAASHDGGRSFARPVWMDRDDAAGMPAVRVDRAGRVDVTWTHFDLERRLNPKDRYSNPSWQQFAQSDDGGRTYSRPISLASGRRSASAFGAVSVTPDGRTVSALWLDYLPVFDSRVKPPGREAVRVLAATSTDGGRTFAAPAEIDATGCVCCEPYGYTAAGRTAFAFRDWQAGTARADIRDIAVTTLVADGWTAPQKVHDDRFLLHHCPSVGPAVAVDRAGTEHVAWWTGAAGRAGYWYATGRNGSFAAPVLIRRHPSAPSENNATIAIDDHGTAWIATVDHGQYDASGNGEDTSPNRVLVYAIGPGLAPGRAAVAGVTGAFPQLASLRGAVAQVWIDRGEILARRLELR